MSAGAAVAILTLRLGRIALVRGLIYLPQCAHAVKWRGMSFAAREYSKGRIDRAGSELVTLAQGDPAWDETLAVINNWRSCHSYPLQSIKMTLLTRAKQIHSGALI